MVLDDDLVRCNANVEGICLGPALKTQATDKELTTN